MVQWLMCQRKWLVFLLVSFIIYSVLLALLWERAKQAEEGYQQAVVLQREQLQNIDSLAKELHISQRNAIELQVAYDREKRRTPAASFTVQAPTLEVAAEQVAERINMEDKSLPPPALEKTDRTVVVKDDVAYKVDVLKINLDKSWEISAGVGNHEGNMYIPVGVQRNYAAHKAVAVEVHLVPEDLAKRKIKTSGWEVRHVWRF